MLGHCILVALGITYLSHFGGHWLKLQFKPIAIRMQPLHFDSWCHLGLGTFYTCAGVFGV